MKIRLLVLAVAMLALAGCSEVKSEDQNVQQDIARMHYEQDQISANVKRIKVVFGPQVKGYPEYKELGRVEGYCFNLPNATGGQVTHGDGLKTAAWRKYGDQVNAIVKTRVWFVSDDSYNEYEPYDEGGYLWCEGTAVQFASQ